MKKLHPKAVWLFAIRYLWKAIFILVVFTFLFAVLVIKFLMQGGWFFLLVLLVICFGLNYLWAKLVYNNWKYEFTESGVKVEKGVISKDYISIPYDRIQNVDIRRGILERMLGLSTLQIQTAGEISGGSEGRLPGLGVETAEEIRERLSERTNSEQIGL